MALKIIRGDLFEWIESGRADVVVHGCNCFHTMNAGLARQMRLRYPQVYEADLATPRGQPSKLGTVSHATVIVGEHPVTIYNAYTQFRYGRDRVNFDLKALDQALDLILTRHGAVRYALPRIGSGLGGGDPADIEALLRSRFGTYDATLIDWQPTL